MYRNRQDSIGFSLRLRLRGKRVATLSGTVQTRRRRGAEKPVIASCVQGGDWNRRTYFCDPVVLRSRGKSG